MIKEVPKGFEFNLELYSEEHIAIRDFLKENLKSNWEIYHKPSLNGLFPDFVLINEWKGIQIIKIVNEKDEKICRIELLKIRKEIINLMKLPDSKVNVTCCLASSKKSFEDIILEDLEYQGAWQDYFKTNHDFSVMGKELINSVFDYEKQKKIFLNCALPMLDVAFDFELKQSSYNKLKAWLRPNDFERELFVDVRLDRRQRDIATRPAPSGTGMRKIKGGAGTGKTLTLAAKAAHLILNENKKKILFLTYTRTTRALSRYSFRRAYQSDPKEIGSKQASLALEPQDELNFTEPVYLHYHGLIDRLKTLNFVHDAIFAKPSLLSPGVISLGDNLNGYMEKNNISFPESSKFDVVLVDEGQLFKGEWWKLAKRLVKDKGEAYIAADFTQDIGDVNAQRWIDDPEGIGIPGNWNKLNESYRLPQKYIRWMQVYLKTFLQLEDEDKSESEVIFPQLAEEPDDREKCNMRWINQEKDPVSLCASIIEDFLPDNVENFSYPDLTFLSCSNQKGYEVVLELSKRKIQVLDTFPFDGLEYKEVDGKKVYKVNNKIREEKRTENWEVTKDKVKASTIHSFQGFETSCLVFLIEPKRKGLSWKRYFKEVYTGLTRLKTNASSYTSEVHVVNMEPELNAYGETWENI